MVDKNDEKLRIDYLEAMGPELGSLINEIKQRVVWLNWVWGEYLELYGKKESRIDLLNSAAPFFFRVVQETHWNSTILTIAKLTDPPSSVGKANLTMNRIPELINDENFKQKVVEFIAVAESKALFCRDWRNRALAHYDLQVALDSKSNPLEEATQKKVNNAIQALSSVIDKIWYHYTGANIFFGPNIDTTRGAYRLLHVIADGLKYAEEKHKRIQSGDFSIDDLKPTDL